MSETRGGDRTTQGDRGIDLPLQPIRRLTAPLERFMHVEAASGIVLLVATIVALALANSPYSSAFLGLWKT